MTRTAAVLAAYAGLAGAAGVALAAAGAHGAGLEPLMPAAYFLLMTAAAVVGIVALAVRSDTPRLFLFAAAVLLIGVTLFSGDIAARSLLGQRLFPMAAPIGGTTMIFGWLVAAAGGVRGPFGQSG